MRLNIVLFAVGAWWLQRQAELPDMQPAWLLALALPAFALARARARLLRGMARIMIAVAALAGGFYWAGGAAHVRLADALAPEWEGRDIELIGVVSSLPQAFERSVRFELDVEHVLTANARVPRRIVLSWWGRVERDGGSVPEVKPGERWRLCVRLKRPHGTANPHGFDYEAWLLERNLRATGHVRPRGVAERLAPLVHRPTYWVEALRERLRTRIKEALGDRPNAGVIVALAMGDQRAISAVQWQVFTRTGVNHLMSISGLHVTMVSAMSFGLALALWRRSARLTLRLPARKAAAVAGAVTALAYTLLAGFAVPAQRTLYMLTVVAVALWAGRAISASVVLAAALLLVVLLDPWAVTAAGFWLSFGAVAAILFVMVNRTGCPHWLESWTRTQAAVTIALTPFLLALFQQVSLVSPIANAFAIPLVSLIVVPLALTGTVLPVDTVLYLAHFCMSCCMYVLEWMSAAPNAVWQQHAPAGWAIVAAIAGALWLLLPRGTPARWLGAVACLPLFFVWPPRLQPGELRVTVLDVGQGLAAVVETAEHALLYDTGPAFGTDADSGNRVIAPYLRAAGVRKLDALILSHDDADHTGGAISVLQALPVAWLMSSLTETDPLTLLVNRALPCGAGQGWAWDGVHFEVLHPAQRNELLPVKNNDRGCVLRVAAPGGSVLIPADIERRSEESLLVEGAALRADVLVAPHHGSKTSSTTPFVEAVRPRAVIFPVGYRNRFGHPHADVLERFRRVGSRSYRTDQDGAVIVTISIEGRITIERYRALYRRYWLHAPVPSAPALDGQLDPAQ